jgi:hypothetical protein
MDRQVYYCILKKYKGLFKKKFVGVTHLFILPRTENDYLYLALLGERSEVTGTYACVYITRIPNEILDFIVSGEKEYFGNRFEIVEQKMAEVKTIQKGTYLIKLKEDSDVFLKKEIVVAYQEEESTPKKRIYNLTSRLDLETREVGFETLGRYALKSLILLQSSRFQ